MRVREAHNSFSWKGNGIGLRVRGTNARARSAQFLLLERSWHWSQGKGGPNEGPHKPAPDLILAPSRLNLLIQP